jgi:hypothetical protein
LPEPFARDISPPCVGSHAERGNEGSSTSKSGRQALIEVALIFAVFAIQGAWPVPDVNEPYYLGKAIHYWNPDWLRGDFFMESADAHKVFYFTFGWLSLWLSPVALAWTGRILTWLPLAWAWRRLSVAVAPRPWYSILTAALFACLMERCHMAGEWVIGGVEAKGFAYVFVFLGLEALVRNRWNRALLMFGAASAFHVLVGGWATVAAGVAWLRLVKSRPVVAPPLRSLWPGLLGGLLLAMPGLIPTLALDWGVDAQTARQAHQIYVFERLPHHLVLTGIRPDFVLRLGLLWAFWLLLGRWSRHSCLPEDRQQCLSHLRAFVTGALVITLIGVAIHPLICFAPALAADLLRYYWFRLTDVALPLGVALEGTALVAGLVAGGADTAAGSEANETVCPTQPRRAWLALAILVAAFHLGDRAIDRVAPQPPRSHRLADFEAWYDACQWVKTSGKIPPNARFLTPRLAQTFKWYTGQSDVATWKDVPQDAQSIVAWWDRIEDTYATGQGLRKGDSHVWCDAFFGLFGQDAAVPSSEPEQPPEPRWYEPLVERGAAPLKQLGAKYGADYLIAERTEPPLALDAVYRNRTYVIYRLR